VFRADKRSISVRPQGRLRSDSGNALLQWAIEGLGIWIAPTFLVSDAVDHGRLEPVLLNYPLLREAGLYVVRPPGPHVPSNVRVLIDTLVARFGCEPLWDRCSYTRDSQR